MNRSFIVLQALLVLAGSDYLYHQDLQPSQGAQTLHLDSDRIYGVREPEGFTPQSLTCQQGTNIVINSVRFGYSDLDQIPLCGEEGSLADPCVVSLDIGHLQCQHNSCIFPSLADWGPESFATAESCRGGLQYWHICHDCIGADYATAEVINDAEHGEEAYEEYQGGDDAYYYYNYYYSDMYHPQVTNRFDVEGNEDLSCENGDLIKILSTKFGYDEQSLKSDDTNDPCVFDFTQQFSSGLCSETECKSPTLKQLGLSQSVALTCGQSPGLGLWQIYYTCEKVGDIDIHEPGKSHDMSHQLETHVESIQSNDLSTSVPLKADHQSDDKNDSQKDREHQSTLETKEIADEINLHTDKSKEETIISIIESSDTPAILKNSKVDSTHDSPAEVTSIEQIVTNEKTPSLSSSTEKLSIDEANNVKTYETEHEEDTYETLVKPTNIKISMDNNERSITTERQGSKRDWGWGWNWGSTMKEEVIEEGQDNAPSEKQHGTIRTGLTLPEDTLITQNQNKEMTDGLLQNNLEMTDSEHENIFNEHHFNEVPQDQNNKINGDHEVTPVIENVEQVSNAGLVTTTENLNTETSKHPEEINQSSTIQAILTTTEKDKALGKTTETSLISTSGLSGTTEEQRIAEERYASEDETEQKKITQETFVKPSEPYEQSTITGDEEGSKGWGWGWNWGSSSKEEVAEEEQDNRPNENQPGIIGTGYISPKDIITTQNHSVMIQNILDIKLSEAEKELIDSYNLSNPGVVDNNEENASNNVLLEAKNVEHPEEPLVLNQSLNTMTATLNTGETEKDLLPIAKIPVKMTIKKKDRISENENQLKTTTEEGHTKYLTEQTTESPKEIVAKQKIIKEDTTIDQITTEKTRKKIKVKNPELLTTIVTESKEDKVQTLETPTPQTTEKYATMNNIVDVTTSTLLEEDGEDIDYGSENFWKSMEEHLMNEDEPITKMSKTEEIGMKSRPEQVEIMEENDAQNYATHDLEQTDVENVAKNTVYKNLENTILEDLNIESTDHGVETKSIENIELSDNANNFDNDDDLQTNTRHPSYLIETSSTVNAIMNFSSAETDIDTDTEITTPMKKEETNLKHSENSGKGKRIERIFAGIGKESTNRQFGETKHINNADLSTQDETISTAKNTKLIHGLNRLGSTTQNYIEMVHDSTNGNRAEPIDESSILDIDNIKDKYDTDNIDIARNNSKVNQKGDKQFTDPNVSPTTLQLHPEMHQTPGTHFEKTNKSKEHEVAQQQTGDVTLPESLPLDVINHSEKNDSHKHQEIALGETFKDENVHHEVAKIEIEHFNEDEHLVKTKANSMSDILLETTDQSDTVSDKTDQSLKTSSSGTKCEGHQCPKIREDLVEPSPITNASDIIPLLNSSTQNYGATNKNIVEPPSLSITNTTDVSEIASLKTDDGNIKTQHNFEYSEDKLATIDPSDPIKSDEREDVKIKNINHHNVKAETMDDANTSKSQEQKLKSNPVDKTENYQTIGEAKSNMIDEFQGQDESTETSKQEENDERNMKQDHIASKNQALPSSNPELDPKVNNDSSLGQPRNESLTYVETNTIDNAEISTEMEQKTDNPEVQKMYEDLRKVSTERHQSTISNDKKHRREKLLLEKGHFKTTRTPTFSNKERSTKLFTTPTTTASSSTTTVTTIETTQGVAKPRVTTTETTQGVTKPRATTTVTTTTKTISTSTRKATRITTKQTPASTSSSTPWSTQAEIDSSISKSSFPTEPNEKKHEMTTDSKPNTDNGDESKMYTYSMDEATTYNILEVDSYSETLDEEERIADINVEPVAESTIEEEIEEEISHGIDQLKSELKMLLAFNHNVLNASNEIIKEATKLKVENFFDSVSASLNLMNIQKSIHKGDKTTSSPKQKAAKKKEEMNTATSILNITADISKSLASTVELGSKVDIKMPNISMTVMKKKMGKTNSNSSSSWEADSLKVNLPDQLTIAGADSSITVSFTSYDNLGSMMSMDDAFSSSVLSVNVLGVEKIGNTIPLTKPMEFILRHKPMKDFSERKCVYWDFEETGWSQKGCYAVAEKSTEETTMCQCYHLTNFAVLVDVYGLAQNEQHKSTLDILTWIGCGISITSLTICIYVFSSFRSAKNDRSAINSNLCFCLLLAELFFLCGIGQTGYPSFCSVVAAVLHYLFLASFFWMLIAGFQIYVLLVEVFEPDGSRFVQYYLLGYIAPLLIVLCSLLMDTLLNYESVYGFRDFCWINSNIHLILTFLMPVFLIVGANVYFLCVAVYKIHVHSRESLIVHKSKTASLKMYVKGLFGLLFLLGVTWGFGIISVTHPSLTFTYIFTILNSLHGFFIFIFNCVMNKKIRNEGRDKIEDIFSCLVRTRRRRLVSRKESTLSNLSASSATSNTNSTMVKEYFLPERMPYTIEEKTTAKKSKQNALSITYYY